MAEALYLAWRSNAAHTPLVNGIRAVLINADNGGSDAVIKAAAVAAAASFTGTDVDSSFRDDYFDNLDLVSDLSAGPLKDDGDAFVFIGNGPPQKVEGT